MLRIIWNGEPVEFEWDIWQDIQHWRFSKFRGFSMTSHLHVHVNDINWTKTGHCNECFSNSEEVKIFAKRFPLGTLVFLRSRRRRKLVWNAQLQTWRTVDIDYGRCRGRKLQRQWTFGILSYRCVGSEFLEQGRWTRYDSHQRWTFERRSFVSHDIHQIISVSTELSWYFVIPQAWRNPSQLERCWLVQSWSLKKWIRWYRHWGRVFRSGRPTANVIKSFSSLWISWIHEESLFRTIVQNHSRWDLEVRQACKRVYSFVIIQILTLLCGSVDTKIGRVLQTELMEWAASKNMEACFRRLFINLLRVECWEEFYLLKNGNLMKWWKLEQGDLLMNNYYPVSSQSTRTKIFCWWRWYGLWHRSQNQTCR